MVDFRFLIVLWFDKWFNSKKNFWYKCIYINIVVGRVNLEKLIFIIGIYKSYVWIVNNVIMNVIFIFCILYCLYFDVILYKYGLFWIFVS